MADEYDLVGLQLRLGGVVVQRHPTGEVRVFGPAGVIRWDGARWRHDAPVDAWISRLERVSPGTDLDGVRPIRVGALLGMRHTSALRYSHDDPEAVVIVVSEAGPITLMHRGEAITSAHPGDEQIG